MTDRFPEAFKRFEEEINVSKVNTLDELIDEFKDWGLERAPITNLQRKVLAIEGVKIGIDPVYLSRYFRKERDISYFTKTGKKVSYHQSAKFIEVYRHVLTDKSKNIRGGTFSSKPKDRVKELE